MERFKNLDSIFDKIDSYNRSFHGFNPIFALQNVSVWRNYFLVCVAVAGCCWAVLGFDSSWSMLKPYIEYASKVFIRNPMGELRQGIPFKELWQKSRFYYGIGNHFSAPFIYGLSFIYLSRYLETIGIGKSLNFCSSTALSLMNIGVFELAWNTLYAVFQHQPWTITFRWKQVTNLSMFTLFIVIGGITLLYLYLLGYVPRVDTTMIFFGVVAVCLWMMWIFYPLPIEGIEVVTTSGLWQNTHNFPQTYYNIDIDPSDGVAIGEPHFVENNAIHLLNVLTKAFTTMTILWASLVKVDLNNYWRANTPKRRSRKRRKVKKDEHT